MRKYRIRAYDRLYYYPFYIQRRTLGVFWIVVAHADDAEKAKQKLKEIIEVEAL